MTCGSSYTKFRTLPVGYPTRTVVSLRETRRDPRRAAMAVVRASAWDGRRSRRIFKAHLIWPHLALDLFHWPGWIDDNATIPAVRYHRLSVSCRFPRRDIDCAPRDPIGLASDFGAVLFDDRLEFLVG